MQGTSIQDLQMNEGFGNMGLDRRITELNQYTPNPPEQFMPNMPSTLQNNNYPPTQPKFQYNQQMHQQLVERMPRNIPNTPPNSIEHLAKDIDSELSKEYFQNTNNDPYTETEEEVSKVSSKVDNGGLLSNVPELLREPLIIIVLYSILSHPKVKDIISKYIPQINLSPDSTGYLVGVVFYGVLLATLYGIVKKLIM